MPARTQGGKLDRRITILRRTLVKTNYNEDVETFVEGETISAGRRDISAAEATRAAEVGAQITARFTVRWSTVTAALTPVDRIRFRGQDYNITIIRDVDRNWLREIDAVVRADK